MPLVIPGWVLFAVPATIALAMMVLTVVTMRQSSANRDVSVYKDVVDIRVKGLEREIDLGRKEIEKLQALYVECKRDHEACEQNLRRLSQENLDLMRRLFQGDTRTPPA